MCHDGRLGTAAGEALISAAAMKSRLLTTRAGTGLHVRAMPPPWTENLTGNQSPACATRTARRFATVGSELDRGVAVA